MKAFRDIRVIPVVVVAIFGFAVLKIAGLVIDGGYVFDYDPQPAQKSWAQDSFNFPTGRTVASAKVDPQDRFDPGDRRILIPLGIFRQQLVCGQTSVRMARDDVGEGAAAVDPELPHGAVVPSVRSP